MGAILFDYVASGKIKCIAATIPTRLTELPDIPTLKEQGWDESVEMFLVLATPKGLPDDVVAKLNEAVQKLSGDADFIKFRNEKLRIAPVEFGSEIKEGELFVIESGIFEGTYGKLLKKNRRFLWTVEIECMHSTVAVAIDPSKYRMRKVDADAES